jgi:GntR family transcriptional regulator
LYQQVAGVLRQRISEGMYPEGSRLAPEDDLVKEFGVSRATIRQAVGQLVDAGLVARRQGSGTFVQNHASLKLQQRFRGSLADLINESHHASGRNIVIERSAPIPERIAAQLGLEEPKGTLVRRTRVMNEVPFSYTVTYLPDSLGTLITKGSLTGRALMEVLIEHGIEIASATQTIRAELADADMSTRIGVDLGAPLLYVERLVKDAAGKPVDYVRSWYRGDRYEYSVELDLSTPGVSPTRSLA